MFLDQNFCLAIFFIQIICGPDFFWTPKYFWTQKFLYLKNFDCLILYFKFHEACAPILRLTMTK